MPFQRFVETGIIAVVSDGPNKGRLVSTVDVIDQTRVPIDGPCSNISRNQIRLNQLHSTKFRIKFPYTASTRVVRKAWNDSKVDEKWAESMWAKKFASKQRRAKLTNFDRFKLRRAQSGRNKIRTLAFYNLKKAASRGGTLYGKEKWPKWVMKPKKRVKKMTTKAPKPKK